MGRRMRGGEQTPVQTPVQAGAAEAAGGTAGGAAAGGAAGGAFGGGAAGGDDWAGAMKKASMAAAEGQRLALQQMVDDVRDKGAAAAAAPSESAAPPESALQGSDRVSQPASQPASLDPSAAANPRSHSGTDAGSLFSKGQLEAWSSGSTLPRGDKQVTSALPAPVAEPGRMAFAEPHEQWATLDGRVHAASAPAVPAAPGASAATAVKPAAIPANLPAAPVATTPAASPAGKPPTRKPKISLPRNPVKLRGKR